MRETAKRTMQHNQVPTTCTATHITGWDISFGSDPKTQVNTKLRIVNELIEMKTGDKKLSFHRDFKLIFVIITQEQKDEYKVDEFLESVGFTMAFEAEADEEESRHEDTGSLFMYCIKPEDYERGLLKYKKELEELKEKIDPPKKPDPARQKFPDLKGVFLLKDGMIKGNSSLKNPMKQIMCVTEEVLWRHIKIKYGLDIRKWNNLGTTWTSTTLDRLKKYQKDWKDELI